MEAAPPIVDGTITSRAPPRLFGQPLVLRSALRRWRSLLSMALAVSLALAVVMVIQAMVNGSTYLYTGDFSDIDIDLYVVAKGGVVVPLLPGDGPGTMREVRHILSTLRGMPEVRHAIAVRSGSALRSQDGPRSDTRAQRYSLVGFDGEPEAIRGAVTLQAGRWARRPGEIVVGEKVARTRGITVGQTLRLQGRDLAVVGIGHLRGMLAGDGSLYAPMTTLEDLSGVSNQANLILVDAVDAGAAERRIAADLDRVAVFTRTSVLDVFNQYMGQGMIIWQLIGFASLAVAGLFVSSMLGRSVAERRIELGTLRAIGVPRRTILGLIGGDAAFVILASATAGLLLSLAAGYWMDRIIGQTLGMEGLYRFDGGSIVTVFLIATLVGLIAAFAPARAALRVEPAEVLREG